MAAVAAALREHLNLFALALQRATVLRAGSLPEPHGEALRGSDAHLPGVGWVVGMAACLAFALVGLALRGSFWGALVAAVAATAATAALTRGSGERGLFRAAERLDPSGPSGTGTLVLVLVLVARLGLLAVLASLSESAVLAALFAGQSVSRLAPLLLARSLGGEVTPRAVQVGAAWCLPPLVLLVFAAGVASLVVAVVFATLACYGMWRLARSDPANRDMLAAAQQACELAFYLGVAVGL